MLDKNYDHKTVESRIYKKWEESGYFNPDNLPKRHKKPFTIIMPPPNANGHLHAGHALFVTLEDIMIRYKRMRGYKTLWVPGADHAGFETQIVYEKKLEKEGRSRFNMDRQDLYKEIYSFTLDNKKFVEEEIKILGASCDWSREKFTLEPEVVKEVQKTFKKMYDDHLVFRGKRIINWCSKHQTTLSDVETTDEEKKDAFYYIQYGPFVIGTARPETKFGDKYVVVHPKDSRYAQYKDGDTFEVEWINGKITATLIKDEAIDMDFGTGAMTITPWHDAIDFEIAEKYKLDKEQIINFRGKLLPIAGEFAGLKIAEARPKIIEKLKSKGLLVRVEENYIHNVPCCYKCKTPIEPQIMDQWFVKMKSLAESALKVVDDGKIKFIPDNYEKIFRYWMNNSIDWNISRQIVWGIPIPAKICTSCDFAFPDLKDKESQCPKCKGLLKKDTDTFDTWFSSGQWPLLSLGYSQGKDWKIFHPTDVMETGHDLIFKWVPRMIIFSLYLQKQIPFHTVYLHGLVNDAKGHKMSKSKGNVINPINIIDKYGTDALRMALIVGNSPGTDMSLSEDKIRGYKNFANKLWNIHRFINSNTEKITADLKKISSYSDKILLKELSEITKDITSDFEEYRFYLAAEKLYQYIWHRFADVIIEESKPILAGPDIKAILSRQQTLIVIFSQVITMFHPFMPFITEEIYQTLPIKDKNYLIITPRPK
ncbi:valine--tRNA ligase [Patescibacteria group bacterium]|nr:valine--tRNA ligase [Patescibacteria group bacterium]